MASMVIKWWMRIHGGGSAATPPAPSIGDVLLMETGDNLLLETGDSILLE